MNKQELRNNHFNLGLRLWEHSESYRSYIKNMICLKSNETYENIVYNRFTHNIHDFKKYIEQIDYTTKKLNNYCNGVYIIINEKSGKHYIGSTIRPIALRIREHFIDLKKGIHHNYKLQSAYNNCGVDSFTWAPVAFCDVLELDYDLEKSLFNIRDFEQYMINLMWDKGIYNINKDVYGFNCDDADLMYKRTGKINLRKSNEVIKRHLNTIPKGNPDVLRKWLDENDVWCKGLTAEEDDRIFHKSCIKFDLEGNKIESYNSIRSAAKQNNVNPSTISACCVGRKKTAYGYIWRHAI